MNIIVCGVGGNGVVLTTRIIADAALAEGMGVKVGEVHGLAMRGGTVSSHLRIGSDAKGMLIPQRRGDILLAFEPLEALRQMKFLKEGGAQAVKIEGGREFLNTVGALTDASIPVMGHLGLTPQSVHRFGGFRVQGRSQDARKRLIEDAAMLERAGCFALVLEGIPFDLAGEITASLSIPTIGIGAGPRCDGQVLVFHDLLGIEGTLRPKFVKRYAELGDAMIEALSEFRREVKSGTFPDLEHSYGAREGEKGRSRHAGGDDG